jgi:chromosomal replication initiation ATPase DnaA
MKSPKKRPTPPTEDVTSEVINKVANEFYTTPANITTKSRSNQSTLAKWATMFALYELGMTQAEISRKMNYADHTAAQHGLQSIRKLFKSRPTLLPKLREIIIQFSTIPTTTIS